MENNYTIFTSLLSQLMENEESAQKLHANPNKTLAELGFDIPNNVAIEVHQNDNRYFYLVINENQNESLTSESLDMIASAKGGGNCKSSAGSASSAATASSFPTTLSSASSAFSAGTAGTK